MRRAPRCSALAAACVPFVVVACGSSDGGSAAPSPAPPSTSTVPSSTGSVSPAAPLTVAPTAAQVLTCGTASFAARRNGSDVADATWKVSGGGTIDASGVYRAPSAGPTGAVTITATSGGFSTTAQPGVATAFPRPAITVAGSVGGIAGISDRAGAARGKRVYTAWATFSGKLTGIAVARSDDGGSTFRAPAVAYTNVGDGDPVAVDCVAIATDAADPDTVYVAGHIAGDNVLIHGASPPARDRTVFLLTSTDGAATFAATPMWGGQSAHGPFGGWNSPVLCPDVISPAPGEVIFTTPGGADPCAGSPDIAVWADAAGGAGFASGGVGDGANLDFVAGGTTHALDHLGGGACPDASHITPSANGGTALAGGTTESPRLFSDGRGRVCIAYIGSVALVDGGGATHAYVQCSDASARTFTAPTVLDPGGDASSQPSTAVGAFGPDGRAAVAWATTDATHGERLLVAFSKDRGATFGAPVPVKGYVPPGETVAGARTPTLTYDAAGVLWVAYAPYDGLRDRLVVDKTCDDGASWSGPVVVIEPPDASRGARFPVLLDVGSAAPAMLSHADGTLQMSRLAP